MNIQFGDAPVLVTPDLESTTERQYSDMGDVGIALVEPMKMTVHHTFKRVNKYWPHQEQMLDEPDILEVNYTSIVAPQFDMLGPYKDGLFGEEKIHTLTGIYTFDGGQNTNIGTFVPFKAKHVTKSLPDELQDLKFMGKANYIKNSEFLFILGEELAPCIKRIQDRKSRCDAVSDLTRRAEADYVAKHGQHHWMELQQAAREQTPQTTADETDVREDPKPGNLVTYAVKPVATNSNIEKVSSEQMATVRFVTMGSTDWYSLFQASHYDSKDDDGAE